MSLGPILQRIMESKRREVEALRREISIDELRARAADAPPARDFRAAVTRPGGVRLIAEVKKASPSKGLIREDFDPVAIAKAYEAGGAAALSVLTDAPFFQGSVEIFQAVRAAVDLPMLRKDFMIDEAQFYESRAMGADAVLLITCMLTARQMAEFHALALELGMAVLVETHSQDDVRRALSELEPAPCLLGINNRDLNHPEMKTDLGHTEDMLPLIRQFAGVNTPPIVSESGIYTPDDVKELGRMRVSAVLVGESLMRQPDPGAAARELMGK
ncbi:TPA: indole-3-glycerol phosphate synthase TrpC [Candidatus Sumerlaeota bacterium]|jgi:indole-3-glycerol phosphate synthase|nr:indole-3-glycerol phosphate synthase TrpC [Candidatus Sumerlaeota bacterium]